MAFTPQNLTNFWENGPQMRLTADQRARLAQEGLTTIDDFSDFNEDTLDDAFKNMKRSEPAIAEVRDAANTVITAAVPAIRGEPLQAIQKYRIHTARIAHEYLTTVARPVTPQTMNFNGCLKDFRIEFDAIMKLKEQKAPDMPSITRELQVMQWQPAFVNYLGSVFGVRDIPLAYVIRGNVNVKPAVDDPLVANKLYGTSGSILEDLINRCSHTHPLFKTDNQSVYKLLETATKGTQYATTVTTFSRTKNGRSAYLAIVTSHIGGDKWDKQVETNVDIIMNREWNGKSYKLEKFCNQHRQAHAKLADAKAHGADVPDFNDVSKVKYLTQNITHQDGDLRAAIALIRTSTTGLKSDFEGAIRTLLPVDPFKPRGGMKRKGYEISAVEGGGGHKTSANKTSYGTGKTGVELCFHKPKEYSKLNDEQKEELRKWRQSSEGQAAVRIEKARKNGGGNRTLKKHEWSAINALVELNAKKTDKKDDNSDATGESDDDNKKVTAAALKVKKIMKRTRFSDNA
ncbi:hypothetical protein CTEN210_18612 [Chaetoceros tenuissimus]|uniref:Uncharacterized protein n=1 Tax=Chaetoceros tenuissimus TaxID=426638 RepID=A0AAD3DF37_9STRA|nr:hypothetical protein CTEN210_18612 [Chaetoceros tenuissimus]